MSTGDVEVDPLEVEDPLGFNEEIIKTENYVESWIKTEPIFHIKSEEESDAGEMVSSLQRRDDKMSDSDLNEESFTDWKPKRKIGRREKTTKQDENETDSNEENTLPSNKRKSRLRQNHLCNICKRTFNSASLLNEHLTNVCQSFSCQYCSDTFSDEKTLSEHIQFAHNERMIKGGGLSETIVKKNERCRKYYQQLKTIRRYQCDICQKTFITSGHLTTHMYSHSNKKWICDGCGKNFSCERSLMRHKDTFPGEHWFPCNYCDVTFFRMSNIAKHIEIKHPETLINFGDDNLNLIEDSNKENKCSKCSMTFVTLEFLLAHKKVTHGEMEMKIEKNVEEKKEMNYKCEICEKEFVSLEGFEYHKTHQHIDNDGKKKKKKNKQQRINLICRLCSAKFITKSALQTHLKSHNVTRNVQVKSGSHQCCICPRSFTSSDGLKYHLATHTGERRYSCDQCGKRFIKKTHLTEHIATHSEVKYFKCPKCPRTFSTHSAYRKHMKHFPGPHSFPCFKCGKLFTKESMIEKHLCVDLVKITLAPEVKALLSEDMIEEYLCIAEEQMAQEFKSKDMKRSNDGSIATSHSCYKCFKVFPNLSTLQAHQNEHIGKQNYQCRFCPENFKRADSFSSHIRNHLGSTPYMCLKCNRKFISPFTLSMHARNYPGDHSFTCQKCQRWFPSETRLDKHECILQNSDYFKCACDMRFNNWNELLNHAGTKPYKCCSCELTYPTLTALTRHIKKHTGAKPFSCEICGKSFRGKNNYLNHKNIHRNAKEFQCEHCDYKSKSQKRLDFHLFRKHDIGSNMTKSTLCPICGIIFPYISQMKKHLELEHRNEFVLEETSGEKKTLPSELCTFCGKMLNNKYTLANHMKKVHGPNVAKKDRKIKCEFCDEKFYTMKKLARHSEIHESPGLRKCDICQKEFFLAKELRKHMRKHDTNKPFSCSQCGKHFKVSVSLKYHSTICGNVTTNRSSNDRRKKKEVTTQSSTVDLIYGHINQIDLNNQPYMLQVYSG